MSSTEITIKNKYMAIPINMNSQRKKICMYENGVLIFDFDAHMDCNTPRFYSYINVERFKGKTVSFASDPLIDLRFTFVDTVPTAGLYKEELRPLVHFTAKIGWINDPNGLVYTNGIYHMFFQHNPAGATWGNMTWGHAVSSDLIHWHELDGAIHPDEKGTMFSGSGIVDSNNISGLQEGDIPPILLYYTAAGNTSALSRGMPSVQCLAYSTDNGLTFKKYEGNPVIPHVKAENRDPKVIFCPELDSYILALYLDGNEYAIFSSQDLINWKEIQRLSLPGDAECPDVYPLQVENEADTVKWVFSGASDRYMVGDMQKRPKAGFVPCQEVLPYFYGKRTSYAAQTFSGTDKRRIKVAWEVLHAPDSIFENQMGIPCRVSLVRLDGRYLIRTLPVKEFEDLRVGSEYHRIDGYNKLYRPLHRKAYDIEISALMDSPDFNFSFFGYKFTVKPSDNTLSYGDVTMPLSYTKDGVKLRIISDVLGCEIFADGGLIYSVCPGLADYGIRYMSLDAVKQDKSITATVAVHTLRGIR